MKRTRSRQYLERLTRWYDPWRDLRKQPWISWEREISVEEARAMYPNLFDGRPMKRIGYSVHAPLEIEVDPWPKTGK